MEEPRPGYAIRNERRPVDVREGAQRLELRPESVPLRQRLARDVRRWVANAEARIGHRLGDSDRPLAGIPAGEFQDRRRRLATPLVCTASPTFCAVCPVNASQRSMTTWQYAGSTSMA